VSTGEREREQDYLDLLYARLDALRERTAAELARVRRAGSTGTPQARSERDAFATLHENRLAQLRSVEDRLTFGRLDLLDAQRRYIGRIGLFDDDQGQLLVDWRAPAAQDFYRATAARPGDVVRRRHLVTRNRVVTGLEDEVLNLDALAASDAETLQGEGMLLATLNASRTGRMADIVATIQAEQDEIIRADDSGVLVVQGGPGTGKTAVALHRAAYLLYTHRERLARRGVLVVGPSPVFLRYIEQVLPSLGETGVVMTTPAELFPGVVGVIEESDEVAALKGDPRMADVIAAAVRNRQRVPSKPLVLNVEGTEIVLRPDVVADARRRARRTHKPHNVARGNFLMELLDHLAGQLARAQGLPKDLGREDRADLISELRASRDVRRELNLLWMPLTPQRLLADLYAKPHLLAAAAPQLSEAERAVLLRDRDAAWTVADVPLLDEAAELLGEDETAARVAAQHDADQRRIELEYAREVLRSVGGQAASMVTAEAMAERFADYGPDLTVAERAAHDRSWHYGHIVVDEAQELSPMMWRLLMRRCPSRSMTVVGDVAQTSAAAGARAWGEMLDPYVADRWRLVELTVNYRTPSQIMEIASSMLAAAGISAGAPRSVRTGDWPPVAERIDPADLGAVVAAVKSELSMLGDGRLAVIGPRAAYRELLDALVEALPADVGGGAAALDARIGVLTPDQAKGLEFDAVVLVEPAAIVAESRRGANDLYVALTRPTQRLRVLHSTDLPPGMDTLAALVTG
jgi:DNA helicase IV